MNGYLPVRASRLVHTADTDDPEVIAADVWRLVGRDMDRADEVAAWLDQLAAAIRVLSA